MHAAIFCGVLNFAQHRYSDTGNIAHLQSPTGGSLV